VTPGHRGSGTTPPGWAAGKNGFAFTMAWPGPGVKSALRHSLQPPFPREDPSWVEAKSSAGFGRPPLSSFLQDYVPLQKASG
jgi:hypothetical protein